MLNGDITLPADQFSVLTIQTRTSSEIVTDPKIQFYYFTGSLVVQITALQAIAFDSPGQAIAHFESPAFYVAESP